LRLRSNPFFGLLIALPIQASPLCLPCHRDVVSSYAATPMAQSSGAVERGESGSFSHNGVRYAMEAAGSTLRLKSPAVRDLRYFIGSGHKARSYLWERDGYLYQAPAAFYAAARRWDLAPSYASYAFPLLTRAIVPGCLQCHATGVRTRRNTLNGYDSPPFGQGGIGCERCHGDASAHARDPRAAVLNPARLPPDARDSICAQCHLSGAYRVPRAGHTHDGFRPGDRISDHMAVFIRGDAGLRVTSHVEDLARSRCSIVSGAKLWCGSCHDPHRRPAPAEKSAWFRAKCESCHQRPKCKDRAAGQNDCVSCHMSRRPAVDSEHTVFTDHSIQRRPRRSSLANSGGPLRLFGGGAADPRDLGIAYAMAGDPEKALPLLLAAVERNARDEEALLYLASLHRKRNARAEAIQRFEQALALHPHALTALTELGALYMEDGRTEAALALWRRALAMNPALTLVRTNVALAYLKSGNREGAVHELRTALAWEPAHPAPKRVLESIERR
jgi:hypothetical protein